MSISAPLLALCCLLQAQEAPTPPAGAYSLFGDQVVSEAPRPGASEYPAEIKTWPGWGPLTATSLSKPFRVDGDWSSVVTSAEALKIDEKAPHFRVKVILLPAVDLLFRTPAGNLDERRTSINTPTRTRIEQGLALAADAFNLQSGGHLTIEFDTSVDSALYEERVDKGDGLGETAVQTYLEPRINGGSFEANDRKYHGPYNLCLLIHAGLTNPVKTVVCGTPATSFSAEIADESTSACAKFVSDAFQRAAEAASVRQGYKPRTGVVEPNLLAIAFGDEPTEQAVVDSSFGPVDGNTFVKNFLAEPHRQSPYSDFHPLADSPFSANAQLSLESDGAKGPVLSARLGSLFLHGGFVIPTPEDLANVVAGPKHFLVFDYRSDANDAIGIGPVRHGVCSGPGIALGPRYDPGAFVAIHGDGKWHKVAVDLTAVAAGGELDGMYFGYLPETTRLPRSSMIAGSYQMANFSFAKSAPADAAPMGVSTGPAWDPEATAARAAAKALGTPEGVLAMGQILDKSNETIKLNALDALATTKSPALEDKLAASIGDINPRITEAAITALAFQDSPTSWATLSRSVKIGPGTHARAVAAGFVAQKKDPASTGPISAIEGSAHDWHDRTLVANALAISGVPLAWTFLHSFYADDEPAVRELAINLTDLGDDGGLHALMFIGVNDPSDLVRASACIKLLQASAPEVKREGYRGANDDSWWVRVQVLQWISAHPSAGDRPALQQAIISPFSAVRAAALLAFAASQSAVSLDEVANVLHDPTPDVQLALISLAKAKGLTLGADVLAGLKASVDPKVVAAANALANN